MEREFVPYQEVDQTIFNRVIFKNWSGKHFNSIDDIEEIKVYYNKCYRSFEILLEQELNKCHPAGWILQAYIQLEAWTNLFFSDNPFVKGNEDYAPIGRYGWRFVIERCLEKLNSEFSFQKHRPTKENMNKVFTILFGMGHVSEYSNYLHFLGERLNSAKLVFSPYLFQSFPELNIEERKLFDAVTSSLFEKTDWSKYDKFSSSSEKMIEIVNEFSVKNFSISLPEVREVVKVFIEKISTKIGASILVYPLDDFIDLVSEVSGFDKAKIKSLVELSFLDVNSPNYKERDFLRKNQQSRMLFNAGLVLDLNSDFKSIYDKRSAKRKDIRNKKRHVIISPLSFGEWLDLFVHKIALGQRVDLKSNDKLKNQLASIESFYRIDVFEKGVMSLLEEKGFICFNLKKLNKKPIECGEIDVIAYSSKHDLLLIIECKALAPIVDARGLGQVINDHFKQKKYHQKFLKKIKWCEENIDSIISIYKERFEIKIEKIIDIKPFFVVSSNSSALNLIVDEYPIIVFYEFDSLLDERYK